MSFDELSLKIEDKVAERAAYARMVSGAPSHIAEAVEPRITELNLQIRELQMMVYHANEDRKVYQSTLRLSDQIAK